MIHYTAKDGSETIVVKERGQGKTKAREDQIQQYKEEFPDTVFVVGQAIVAYSNIRYYEWLLIYTKKTVKRNRIKRKIKEWKKLC